MDPEINFGGIFAFELSLKTLFKQISLTIVGGSEPQNSFSHKIAKIDIFKKDLEKVYLDLNHIL